MKKQRQYIGVKIVFSTNGAGTTGHPHTKKLTLDTDLTLFTKINSKYIIDLIGKCKTIKYLEDNAGSNLIDCSYGDEFLDTTPSMKERLLSMKEGIDNLGFIKIKNFCSAKHNVKRMRR